MTQSPPRPHAIPVQADQIPTEIKLLRRWVVWRYEYRPDQSKEKPWTKPPFQVNGTYAKSNDPDTWTIFETALQHTREFDGIGFMFSANDPYIGIDLDHCRDPIDGSIEPWAQEIIDRLNSYSEVSASGTGIHLLVKGKLPEGGRKKGGFEIYKLGRYFTTTGHHLTPTPQHIHERQPEIDAIHAEVFGQKAKQETTTGDGPGTSWADDYILQRMFEAKNGADIRKLWDGDTSAYGGDA
jgi:putative DNA primase/helicase